ncbi:hypothetical protein [Hugenholtzia roseola]|uniref:hypothetical protein n=1 Tax=Hugenholtzia roseola TaxID=1002 RepID=UPI000406543C|nr:hypothetical protein [Hugenholtzia roseola]
MKGISLLMASLFSSLGLITLQVPSDWVKWNPLAINEVNKSIREGTVSYQEQDYKSSARAFRYLLGNEELVSQDAVALDLAHSYFNLSDTAAVIYYNQAHKTKEPHVKSLANLQLGVMKASHQPQNLKGEQAAKVQKQFLAEALNHFKEALRANPQNKEARHNYELLKRLIEQQKQQEQQNQQNQQNQDQDQQQEQQQQQQSDQQEQAKEEPEDKEAEQNQKGDAQDGQEMKSAEDQLKELNISPEKAQMILDAMKNSEVQYLQQNQRKVTKPRDPSKPDW